MKNSIALILFTVTVEDNDYTPPSIFEEFTIQDRDGNIYMVRQPDPQNPEKVELIPIGKAGEGLTADNFNPKRLDDDRAVVTFRKGAGFYAFDTWKDYYEKAFHVIFLVCKTVIF